MKDAAQALENDNELFSRVRDDFLSKLSDSDRSLYSPCTTSEDLIRAIEKLDILRRRHPKSSRWMQRISNLAKCLQPYFEVIGLVVSSHPEFSAIVWGALRLVFQLAGNFSTFFDKLTELFERLVHSFPQYDMIITLCDKAKNNEWADGDEGKTSIDKFIKDLGQKIRYNIETVYRDLFQIIHTVIRVFTKSTGRLKKTPVVMSQLIWKPFDLRFGDLIKRIEEHRQSLFEDVLLMVSGSIMKDISSAAKYQYTTCQRQLDDVEVKDSREEKTLIQERERLNYTQREIGDKALEYITFQLENIQGKLDKLENDRLERTYFNFRVWLSPSNYTDSRNRASRSRQDGTANWIFDKPFYLRWREKESVLPSSPYKFDSRVLWIYGHPGSGKTTLASALLDYYDRQVASSDQTRPEVFYFFFEELYSHSSSPIHAYRAILAQIIKKQKSNETMLDRFAFIMNSNYQGDPVSSEAALVDLLQLCLESNSIFVLDGIDECRDNDSLIEALLGISKNVPSLQIIFLSRVNVIALQRTVPKEFQHKLAKDEFKDDISLFCCFHLQQLFDQQLLPDSARDKLGPMVEKLVHGADGMFLWARLMINYLRLSVWTPRLRLAAIDQVKFPEGLEKMYERIFLLITSAGHSTSTMASKVLAWSAYSLVPMTSYQVRQALIADGHLPVEMCSDDIAEFEESAIMVCAGLVERHDSSNISEFHISGSITLQLSHSSVRESLDKMFQPSSHYSSPNVCILPNPMEVNLYLANTCLRQLLYHTPAQPLSGKLGQRLLPGELAAKFPFTDHSGVCWMNYLSAGMRHMKNLPHIRQVEARCLFEDDAFHTATKTLWSFLQKPAVMSTWLESFYSAREFREVLGCEHPPIHLLDNWPASSEIRSSYHVSENHDLGEELSSFGEAIKEVVNLWGHRLEEAPEIIWNEMTGFIHRRFFFHSLSTHAISQNPDPPPLATLSTKPIAVLSRTTRDGHWKGILSIWPPRIIHDTRYIKSVQRFEETDLTRLCTGWIAAYDVWTVKDQARKVMRMQLPLDNRDVLFDIRRCLGQGNMDEIELAITIAPDILSFSVLQTVFMVHPQSSQNREPTVLIRKLPAWQQIEDFSWNLSALRSSRMYSYSVHSGAVGRYLVLTERNETGRYLLTMYRYTAGKILNIEKVSSLHLWPSSGFNHVTFHPTLSMMAFSIVGTEQSFDERAVVIWMFSSDESMTMEKVDSSYSSIKTLHFSECGSYLVVQLVNLNDGSAKSVVLAVPMPFLQTPGARIDSDTLGSPAGLIDRHTIPSTSAGSLLPVDKAAKSLTHAAHVGPSGSTRIISIAASNGDIELSSKAGSESLSTKLAMLPPWSGLETMTYTLTPPSAGDRALKISVDMPPRLSYPLRGSDSQAPIMSIEKDVRAINIPPTLKSITLPSPDVQALDGSVTLGRKRHLEQTDWYEDREKDSASQRSRQIRP